MARNNRNKNRKNYINNNDDDTRIIKETGCARVCIFFLIALLTVIPFIFIVICVGLAIYVGITENSAKEFEFRSTPAGRRESNVDQFGEYIYLQKIDETSYKLVTEEDTYDKKLEWANGYYSYYEVSPFTCVWYDESDREWHYWFQYVSGNYGGYGWMRIGKNSWEIQKARDKWTSLPEKYDRNHLWYIKNE